MFRADQAICGTSTTGTGTLTLAATPVAPGGIDLDVWARATGFGFGNSAAIPGVSYTIIEYTSTSFSTTKSFERGIGTLTLGSSSGIANATLSRDVIYATGTSLNSQPATASAGAPSAISIGTAANVLVFIGASAMEIPAFDPYIETSGDNLGPYPFTVFTGTGLLGLSFTSGTDYFYPFLWGVPGLFKRFSCRTGSVVYIGGTSNLYARIYANNASSRPGKLLYDFGVVGTPNASLSPVNTNISSGASGNGIFLQPQLYWMDILAIYSGGTNTPTIDGTNSHLLTGCLGTSLMALQSSASSTGGNATAPDPANVTAYTVATGGAYPYFALKGS